MTTSTSVIVFTIGMLLLALLAWYLVTDNPGHKRRAGAVLTVLLTAFCVYFLLPRKTNFGDDVLRLSNLGEKDVKAVKEAVQSSLSDADYVFDPSDTRDTFPGKSVGTYDAAGKRSYRMTHPTGLSQIYVIDGVQRGAGEAGDRHFLNVYKFWNGEKKFPNDKLRSKARHLESEAVTKVWKGVAKAVKPFDRTKAGFPVQRGIDLEGGSSFLVQIQPRGDEPVSQVVRERAIEILQTRLNALGGKDLFIAPQGDDSIQIQMPGISDENRDYVREQLSKTAILTFHYVHPRSSSLVDRVKSGEEKIPGFKVLPAQKEEEGGDSDYLVESLPRLRGDTVTSARAENGMGGWQVGLRLNSEGAKQFGNLTSSLMKKYPDADNSRRIAIVLDDEVVSAPVIQETLFDQCQITGQFTQEEATNLATSLENPLQQPLVIVNERSVSPTLGKSAVRQGLYAGLAGLMATLIFLILYYRFAGLVALIGLVLSLLVLLGAMAMFGFTLTLPGIAGIVLTIGIAIDANVLIYERLKEEIADGKKLGAAIDSAYQKAFSAIFDANVTTLITAVILYLAATGPVKGFAVTLITGILGSMFAVLIVTRLIFNWAAESGFIKKMSFWQLIPNVKTDFLGKRRIALVISCLVIALALGTLVYKRTKALGVDFKGGDLITLQTVKEFELSFVQSALDDLDLPEKPVVQRQQDVSSGDQLYTIRMLSGESSVLDKVTETLKSGLKLDENASIIPNRSMGTVSVNAGDALTLEAVQGVLAPFNLPADSIKSERDIVAGSSTYTITVKENRQIDQAVGLLEENLQLDEGDKTNMESIGPAIGKSLLVSSIIALSIGLVAILIYLTLRFEFSFAFGAIVALMHDLIISIGLVVLFGRELSLIMIGAFLTIAGYSINDTIVVFDRIREGLKTKRGDVKDIMNDAIRTTLRRTVLTSLTTLIAVFTLFVFGGPDLRDFSLAIIIGVIVGTYSSIFVAAPFVLWWTKKRNKNLRREVLDAEQAKVSTTGGAEEPAIG